MKRERIRWLEGYIGIDKENDKGNDKDKDEEKKKEVHGGQRKKENDKGREKEKERRRIHGVDLY